MKKRKGLKILLALLSILIIWITLTNVLVIKTEYQLEYMNLPKDFDGLKIAQISDYHNRKGNKQIVKILEKEKPDVIFITGDFIDSYNTKPENAISFIKKINGLAPIYYVPGNHESRVEKEYSKLKEDLSEYNVTILENSITQLECNESYINIIGVIDPSFRDSINDRKIMKYMLTEEISIPKDSFNILLTHRPELLDIYGKQNIDLVFSGHAHGGQFRIPGIGGVFSPNQDWFPKLTEGIHKSGNATMIISRGLGNSILPIRINNTPEVVIVTLSVI